MTPLAKSSAVPALSSPNRLLSNRSSRVVVSDSSRDQAARVSISEEAQRLAAIERDQGSRTGLQPLNTLADTRSLIKRYDFSAITPNEMAQLGSELFRRGEITQDVANSFVGVEMNTIVTMDPNEPIDMISHFERMLVGAHNVEGLYSFDNFAVTYREEASAALYRLAEMAGGRTRDGSL